MSESRPAGSTPVEPGRQRCRGERGAATSLAMALLTPVFVVLAFAAFQAAMWSHARTEARVVARDAAGLVARAGVSAQEAAAAALRVLETDSVLRDADVDIGGDLEMVVVSISGRAPGIIRGTSADVSVVAALPRERWQP
jgi:hypothetical protein